jgi:hypothetical protein
MAERNGEFYVGYLEKSPPMTAARSRRVTIVALVIAAALAAMLVYGQGRFDPGVFEFGVDREFEGIVVEHPYPMLLVPEGSETKNPASFVTHYLVAFGKYGAARLVEGLDGEPVRITGSLIFNDQQQMIEVHEIEPVDSGAAERVGRREPERRLGTMTLVGEIVDAKCHFGSMKPGRGKVHKACAIRCISGGVQPVLRVEDRSGRVEYFLLVSTEGKSVNAEVLGMVAEPVEITGEVARAGDLLILYADPVEYRRIASSTTGSNKR